MTDEDVLKAAEGAGECRPLWWAPVVKVPCDWCDETHDCEPCSARVVG